jgi:hypothetical protein
MPNATGTAQPLHRRFFIAGGSGHYRVQEPDGIPTRIFCGGHLNTPRASLRTFRNYHSEAIAKLGAANSIDAAHIARTRGWL